MKTIISIVGVLFVLNCLTCFAPPGLHFNPFLDINHLSAEEIVKTGLRLRHWPPSDETVKVHSFELRYDTSVLSEHKGVQGVQMFVDIENKDSEYVGRFSTQGGVVDQDTIYLQFSILPEYISNSVVRVFFWRKNNEDGASASGNEFNVSRILELVPPAGDDDALGDWLVDIGLRSREQTAGEDAVPDASQP
jgi:hypothetical protein